MTLPDIRESSSFAMGLNQSADFHGQVKPNLQKQDTAVFSWNHCYAEDSYVLFFSLIKHLMCGVPSYSSLPCGHLSLVAKPPICAYIQIWPIMPLCLVFSGFSFRDWKPNSTSSFFSTVCLSWTCGVLYSWATLEKNTFWPCISAIG